MIQKLTPFIGLNKDLGVSDLPLGAITDCNNVRFREGYAELFLGQANAYTTCPIPPYSAFPVRTGSTIYWLVLGAAKAYCVTGAPATWTNITRSAGGDYSASLDTLWNGGVLNGVPVVNNGVDAPQYWSTIATGTPLAALPSWPAGVTCRVMRPFLNYWFAFDVTKAGTRYPHRVKWSHPAEPGTVPTSWDETDATKDAGEFDLDGAGFIVDAMPLGNTLIVYKQFSTYACTYTGGSYIFNFRPLFSGIGMMAPDCGVEIDGTHYVFTQSDIVRHDGSQVQSILDKATRRWLLKNIDNTQYERCFVTKSIFFNEVWFCFPSVGNTSCNKALVYNYKDGVLSIRDIANAVSGNSGQVEEVTTTTYDGDSAPFSSDASAFDENEYGANTQRTLLCSATNTNLILLDSGTTDRGSVQTSYMERIGITLDDPNRVKTVKRLRPRVLAPSGTVLKFRVGGSMDVYGPISWSSQVTFTVGTDVSVDAFASGRYLAWRMDTDAAYSYRIEGMDVEFEPRGGW